MHLVTAWTSEQRLVLGQAKVEDHSNEITAIPALLELLDIQGAIITIETALVQKIRDRKADYVLTMKANHPTLYAQVKDWFEMAQSHYFEDIDVSYGQRLEKGHHRLQSLLHKACGF